MKSIAGLVLLACCAAIAVEQPPTLKIGDAAPDFSLPSTDGKTYALKDFASAKLLVIVFTCNHCPTAQAYEDRLMKIVDDYKDKGVTLIAINPNNPKSVRLDELGYTDLSDSFAEMKIRAAHKKYNFVYLDGGETQDVPRAYGPRVTPHAFVFDAERKLRYVGRIDDNERGDNIQSHDLRNALDALLAGKTIDNPDTKAFGCSTKWLGKEEQVKAYMAKLAAEPVTIEMADAAALKALAKNDSGKVRLVNFWATTCGPCVTEFPELVTMHRMFGHRAFEVVTVAMNHPDEKKEVEQFLKKQQASCRNLLFATDDKYKLIEAFDKDWDAAIPYSVLIGADGKVIKKINGEFDHLELKRLIVKALSESNHGAVKDPPKSKK